MSQTAEELLIIYETEAEQWATYLKSVFTGPISEDRICCYDINTVSSSREDFIWLAQYNCKLLILSKGMLECLCPMWRFFLARVLSPAAHVVVLLCGVESLKPLVDLVPLNAEECLQISSEQDAHEYLPTVVDIAKKGLSATAANVNHLTCKLSGSEQKAEQMQSTGAHSIRCKAVVVPSRVPCGTSVDVFILLKNDVLSGDAEVEFTDENQTLRVKPVYWNDRILCVKSPDFPAGNVSVTVYSDREPLSKARLQYYSSMEEIHRLLSTVADPVDFMCQALQVSSVDKLDEKLCSMLLEGMPTGGFRALQCDYTPEREIHSVDVPSLLHFAAQYGFKSVSSLLLQCPGANQALHTANRHGQTPTEIAKCYGHKELHILLRETLNTFNAAEDNGDTSVYEVMCTADVEKEHQGEGGGEEVEDLYAPLGVNDEYDTILNSSKTVNIANRPPAPTPRPESTQVKDDKTPYIAQVFQKKKTAQGEADLYSLPTKQARGREDSMSSTYDTFVPNQIDGLQQLIELQQRVKAGSLTVDEALERFSDWQRVQKGMNAIQQEKLSQLRASIINKREDDDSVYDKINIVHHTPSVNEGRIGGQPVESDFYSKPLKGHHSHRKGTEIHILKGHSCLALLVTNLPLNYFTVEFLLES
ncbi:B-cell scaffold protein with ankyrin repeats isoform X2 [Echeneis naucrates]|uniref:B-cell scaffold protein with ankyrin repeats isoform X2 n=1 Tax=Echeneis naucrates TaxID=173247 RepID=UPI0011141631|nr:B-cell scaffold protein with ankyrin repeats isoform X2 [Echeneis naucrates]